MYTPSTFDDHAQDLRDHEQRIEAAETREKAAWEVFEVAQRRYDAAARRHTEYRVWRDEVAPGRHSIDRQFVPDNLGFYPRNQDRLTAAACAEAESATSRARRDIVRRLVTVFTRVTMMVAAVTAAR